MRLILIFFIALASAAPAGLTAHVALPHFFSDHMVLQRERPAAIWGTAEPNAKVTVSFKGNNATVKADATGRWRAEIPTGPADAEGAKLTVSSGGDSVTIDDVLVGEVWLASGQSNMVFTMNRVPAYEDLLSQSNHPLIRMFNAPTVTSVEPRDDIAGEWTLCSPKTAPGYSAVAFFFARNLHEELGVPIGVIKTAWGGKPVETFTSREALNTLRGTKTLVDAAVKADAAYDPTKARTAYETKLEKWKTNVAAWKEKPADAERHPRSAQSRAYATDCLPVAENPFRIAPPRTPALINRMARSVDCGAFLTEPMDATREGPARRISVGLQTDRETSQRHCLQIPANPARRPR